MKVLVTGSAGFIGGYVVEELLSKGHFVVGIDNFSKYGLVKRSYDNNKRYRLVKADIKDTTILKRLAKDCDYIIAGAAKIGGISYFHEFAYDLLAENERIIASTFDAAIDAHKNGKLKKIIVVSSSMVFESTKVYPTKETAVIKIPPPQSTYGFQKLACEYFAKGAWEQYKLPFTIVRPFNCVGIGEMRAKSEVAIKSGNIRLAMSHVVPDLVQKVLRGQDPLHILGSGKQIRHYTYGGDLAKGIVLATFSPKAKNEDFNLSTKESTTVLQLAKLVWKKINPDKPFRYISDKPFTYDVQKRVPDTKKAEKVLGFKASTTLSEMLDEVIPWVQQQIAEKNI
ncbi:MAG: NAD-dependent epimerase/dehydratase family protein [Patescibacteria group bacterium]|nr:NAD-dependent epimerase/dehydratase family protein [Patescibacteria group bacterium]